METCNLGESEFIEFDSVHHSCYFEEDLSTNNLKIISDLNSI